MTTLVYTLSHAALKQVAAMRKQMARLFLTSTENTSTYKVHIVHRATEKAAEQTKHLNKQNIATDIKAGGEFCTFF